MNSNGDHPECSRKEEQTKSLLGILESILLRLRHDSNFVNGGTSLADGQVMLLFMLFKRKCCKATDIANHIGITSGAITAMTDKLESLGLIRRERSEEDRRLVLLSLTEQGQETVKNIHKHRFNILFNRLSALSDEELEQLLRIFEKINAQFADELR